MIEYDSNDHAHIWWVEVSCNLNMCAGFDGHYGTGKVSVRLDGARNSVESMTFIAPAAKDGYHFVGWREYDVKYINDSGYTFVIKGYEAVYE